MTIISVINIHSKFTLVAEYIAGAVQRKYESLRMMDLLMDKEYSEETLIAVGKAKRYRSRRQRVCKIYIIIYDRNDYYSNDILTEI